MPSLYSRLLILGVFVASLAFGLEAPAQTDYTWIGADGDYDDNNNWDLGFPPTGEFDERAVINNGGTARVSSTVLEPAQVILGGLAASSGSLIIENGGNLTVYNGEFADENLSTGGINVGENGTGTLVVQPGGTLNSGYIIVLGVGSSVTFDGSGASPATVFIENIPGKASGTNVFGGHTFRVIGDNVNYTTANFDLEPGSIFIPEITGSTHSTIKAPNGVSADGILRVEFNGYTPTIADTWNLFDASAVNGEFSAIESSGATLPVGQILTFKAVPDGSSVNGVYGQLGIEQRLVLRVNRDTRAVSIETGTEAVNFDGYVIRSALGGIDPTEWNSLQDQMLSDWRESSSPGTENAIAELKPTTSTAVTSGVPLQLGNLFDKPLATVFGTQELEDIEFEYYTPDGRTIQAEVIYEGEKQYNNLVLVVDPVDGDAILQNQSNLSVSIDGYNIHSDSGSLLPNNGDWLSLEDQGSGTWRESGETVNDLSELLPTGSTAISGGTTFNLGSPFKTVSSGGVEDLSFRYLFPGDSEFTDGVVVYRDVDFQLVGRATTTATEVSTRPTTWCGERTRGPSAVRGRLCHCGEPTSETPRRRRLGGRCPRANYLYLRCHGNRCIGVLQALVLVELDLHGVTTERSAATAAEQLGPKGQ